ncbi:MAG TPA: hypothetical protein VFE78_20635 [Gemmataceae bacterium]|jgi:hypothetical protein|nr:hypothetical protein [Gemmataceae bacterium]
MPRPRKFWRRKGSEYLYTKIDGVQTRLEKTEAASQRKLEQLLRKSDGPSRGPTFASVADKFLDHSLETNEKETYEVHKLFLQSFKDRVGRRKVQKLCEDDLDGWLRSQATWNDNTKVRARAIVLAALNHSVRKLNLPNHPLRHVRPGTVERRERYLTPEERKAIREGVKGVFAEYVLALELTGHACSRRSVRSRRPTSIWTKGPGRLPSGRTARSRRIRSG